MESIRLDIRGEGSQENAFAQVYILDDSEDIAIGERPMVIVCPGGAYAWTSDREAEIVALQFCAMGYHAAVLRYSVAPAVFPAALLETGRLVQTLKSRRKEWRIDPEKIIIAGFSAGGHLAASFCTMWHEPWVAQKLGCSAEELRPGAMILGYPVITSGEGSHEGSLRNLLGDDYERLKESVSLENRVSEYTPRTFLWHTFGDGSVDVRNSIKLADALARYRIPAEVHLFERGGHGLSLASRMTRAKDGFGIEPTAQIWIELAHAWIEAWCAETSG